MLTKSSIPKKIILCLTICLILSICFAYQSFATGGTGNGGHTEIPRPNLLAGYGMSCNYAPINGDWEGDDYIYNCPHWIKAPISVFDYVYNNRGGKYPSTRRTTVREQDVLETCTNPNKNTDGYIYFSGYYGVDADRNINNLLFMNHTDNWVNSWKRDRLDLSFSVGADGRVNGGNIFNSEVTAIYNAVLSLPGRTPYNLAMFCSAMVDREVPFNGTYQSRTRAKVGNTNWGNWNSNSADYFIQDQNNDDKKINTTFYYEHQLKSSLNRDTSPNWSITRDSSGIGSGRKTLRNQFVGVSSSQSPSVTKKIYLGTKQTICQTISHPAGVEGIDLYRVDQFVRNKTMNYYGSSSSSACATARHPYDFTTSASINPLKDVVNLGESISATGQVKNSGTHDNNGSTPHTITPSDTEYRLFWFTIPANVSYNGNLKGKTGYSSGDPCSFYRNSISGNCRGVLASGKGSINPQNSKQLSKSFIVPDSTDLIGQKVCVATAISYTNSGTGYNDGLNRTWAISPASCATVAKKPNFQVWGGIYSPSTIKTAQSTKNGITYGSWAEHLVIAKGDITKFGSGASLGYNGYNLKLSGGNSNGNMSNISPLTVANNNKYGSSNIEASPEIIDSLKRRFAKQTVKNYGIDYRTNTNIGRTELSRGTIVYNAGNNDVTISGNICYTSSSSECNAPSTKLSSYSSATYNSTNDLPQILIFAKNIKINQNVTRIDAWLIADGTINTCEGKQLGAITANNCNNALVINGPVFAKKLELHRTAGANSGTGDSSQTNAGLLDRDISKDGSAAPAEVFNLRGDAYLWSYTQAQRTNEAITTYTRELAPRL